MNVAPDDRDLEFPPLMLISLVENAIKHGVEVKPGDRTIEIRSEKMAYSKLRISVLDNGPGLSMGLGGGLGLSNIREQLNARFGDTASLNIATRPEGGTIASIEVPAQISKDSA
jgi:sensor histidine kinase YesM